LAARLSGLSWREACAVGSLMNARGLMELIVINVGHELGVIPQSVFFMLVFMAVVTTYMTAPVLRRTLFTANRHVYQFATREVSNVG
jgi:Kef-type K+ transport system membrane component KefB